MIPVRKGMWSINRVSINSNEGSSHENFRELHVSENTVRIEPAGIDFLVNQSTSKSAVLESRSQIFFADFFEQGERLRITLSRPSFAETISLDAEFSSVSASMFA